MALASMMIQAPVRQNASLKARQAREGKWIKVINKRNGCRTWCKRALGKWSAGRVVLS